MPSSSNAPSPANRIIRAIRRRLQLRYRKLAGFRQEFQQFEKLSGPAPRFPLDWQQRYPCLEEATAETDFDPHYIYHPAWAARQLAADPPKVHIDISSSLTFCSIVSAFIPVEFYDFRPAPLKLSGLHCGSADLTALSFETDSIASLSCMHVIEHIGLGRYGDAPDPEGDLKAMKELTRVLAPGGKLLFVTPVGRPVLRFNAHRIYSFEQICAAFGELKLQSFALLPDDFHQGLIEGASAELVAQQSYGCGCFCFTKAVD
ncbi:DUF268 domain-containing protein [bacterium]|nr:MAG: DUF268 domain-containing protein [bacterium]